MADGDSAIKPVDNWRLVLRHAWSVRLIGLAALLSGAEVAIPLLTPFVPQHYLIGFAALVFVVIVAAFIARFVAQEKLGAR